MEDDPLSLRAAIEAWRQSYRPDPEPFRTVLNPHEYEALESAVERGQTSEWLTTAFRAGRFVRAELI